ncbi:unnamed protein product [Caenorhabditis brenneri]
MDSPGSSSQANENNVPGDDSSTDPTNNTPKATPKTPKRNAIPLRPVQVADLDTNGDTDEDVDGEMDGEDDGETDGEADRGDDAAESDDEQKPAAASEKSKRYETKADIKRKKDEAEAFTRSISPKETHWPEHYIGRCQRENLRLEPFELGKQKEVDGEFWEHHKVNCAFCHSAVSPQQDAKLIACHGQINGESIIVVDKGIKTKIRRDMEEYFRPCKSHFHQECIMKYNADNFCYQYAARTECQGRLLCPLHCCSSCDTDHLMQSSYYGQLTECALCLRAFHSGDCYPAGAREINVTIKIDGRPVLFEMMVCPLHAVAEPDVAPKKKAVPGKKRRRSAVSSAAQSSADDDVNVAPNPVVIKKHINLCHKPYCWSHANDYVAKPDEEPLIECRTCIRSFHARCLQVATIDGGPIPGDQCEWCVCNETIHKDTPVIAYWKHKNEFWLAETRGWDEYPTKDRRVKTYEKLGYTCVQWIEKGRPTSFNLLPTYHIASLIKGYFKMATVVERPFYEEVFKLYDETALERAPQYLKAVLINAKVSKFLTDRRPPPELYDSDLYMCSCPPDTEDRCTNENCGFFADEHECPPECDKVKGGCNNRRLAKGYVSPKVELRNADAKGYGVFANAPIKSGEFISEYVGEIIEDDEKQRRMNSISFSGDYQANHYMMGLVKGWTIDATTYGNITRYINHSCSPNCITLPMFMFVKKLKKTKGSEMHPMEYERRIYIRAEKDIKKDEELTFSYKMDGEDNLPACLCGAPNCNGTLGGSGSQDDKDKKKNGKRSQNPKKDDKGGQNAPSTSSSSGQTHRGILPPSTSATTASDSEIRHGNELQESKPSSEAGPAPSEPLFKTPKMVTPLKPSLRQTSVLKRGSAGNTPTSSPLARGADSSVFAVPSLPSTSSITRTPIAKPTVASQDLKARTAPIRTASVRVGATTPIRMASVRVGVSPAARSAPRSVSVRGPAVPAVVPIHQAQPNNDTPVAGPTNSEPEGVTGKRKKVPKKYFQMVDEH